MKNCSQYKQFDACSHGFGFCHISGREMWQKNHFYKQIGVEGHVTRHTNNMISSVWD